MSDQYIGEIRYFPYMRGAPSGWLQCDGSLQSIADYQALAAVLGTTYGGDGSSQFGLPDLRGRVPIGNGGTYPLGQAVGTETASLNVQNLPAHGHFIEASTLPGSTNDPTGMVYASAPAGVALYTVPAGAAPVQMGVTAIGSSGQGLPHENCAPTMPILACIAWDGIYPTPAN